MICPHCGSSNVTVLSQENKKGYGFCSGFLGFLILGVPGLICGLCGMGETKSHDVMIVCGNCGRRTRI